MAPFEHGLTPNVMRFLRQVIRSPKRSRSRASATLAIWREVPTSSHAGWSISAGKCACCAIGRLCFHFTPRHPLPERRTSVVPAEPMETSVRPPERPPTPFATTSSSSQRSWVSPQSPPTSCFVALTPRVPGWLGGLRNSCFRLSGVGTATETAALASHHRISRDQTWGHSAVFLFKAVGSRVSVSRLAPLLPLPIKTAELGGQSLRRLRAGQLIVHKPGEGCVPLHEGLCVLAIGYLPALCVSCHGGETLRSFT